MDQVLGIGSFSLDKCVEINPEGMETYKEEDEANAADDHGHVHDEHCTHDHDHDHAECTLDHDHSAHDHDHSHNHSHDHSHAASTECTLDHDHSSHDHAHDHEPATKKKKHNLSLVSSVGFTIKGQLDTIKFNTFMSDLLAEKAADLYRTKGVLAFHGQGDTKFVFQGVHEQINFGPADKPWGATEERVSKMVFIGKNLDYEFFKKSLAESVAPGETAHVTMHKRA